MAEIHREVGLPRCSAGSAEYQSPDWEDMPGPTIGVEDLLRTLDVMRAMAKQHNRLHRDMRFHYRDGGKLAYHRIAEGQATFRALWLSVEL